MKILEIESNLQSTINEAGSFSYGYKKPRKGSVADLAAKKRKEQEKNYVPIESKDQLVGTAKLTSTPDGKKELQWSALGEDLSVDDRMSIIEEYYTTGNLTESTDEDKKDYFKSLSSMSDTPIPKQKYIVASLALVGNKIMNMGVHANLEFVKETNQVMVFNTPDGKKSFPSYTMRDMSIFNTFTFSTADAYNKFRSALSLKFDTLLPNVKIKQRSVHKNNNNTSDLEKQTTLEATYSYGGAMHTEFNIGDTVRHNLLGNTTVINFSGSSVIVRDNKGKLYKAPASSLLLVQRKHSTPAGQTQTAPTVTSSQQGTPIGQSITYNTTKGPVKFTKTNKGWEALVGTAKKLFTTGDQFYNTLEKIWQSKTGSA